MAKKPAPKPRAPKVPKGGLPGRVASPREMFDSKVAQRMAAIEKAFGSPENFAKPPKGGLPGTVAKPKVAKPKLPAGGLPAAKLPKGGLPGTVAKPKAMKPAAPKPPKGGLPGTVAKPKAVKPAAPKLPKGGLPGTVTKPPYSGTLSRMRDSSVKQMLQALRPYEQGLPSSGRPTGGGGGGGGMGASSLTRRPRP